MKKLMMILVAVIVVNVAQAQEKVKKDTYIQNGDLIEATLYHDDGTISQQGFFTAKGVITGEWVSYNRNGEKLAVAQYDKGAKVGTWFFWSDDNTLKEVQYSNSKIASVNVWKNEGERVVSNK
ncbi:nicotinic acid mononucleotide adenyltransferase [Dokdonia sinensis]|uniref:Nicotinic acid mononucleotide adenyltransferase n=1 Tax=Dokdonia sinensis TaxID=2479847 RepID=A0A3M0G1Y6_9FLAO|nr:nicotinic acid mononucleotide adenyltransferase [Dokdonia sinensis]RMB58588.1 nicotinic acid mononucleotide adenyltransferase [Dokdonia sinensis]